MTTNNDRNKNGRLSENDSSKPMGSKGSIENSNDNKTDQDFPGYPHYPAKEDIMDQRTDSHRVDANMENLASGPNASGLNQRFTAGQERNHTEAQQSDDTNDQSETENTGDSLDTLNSRSEEIGKPQNVSNEDLKTNSQSSDPEVNKEKK